MTRFSFLKGEVCFALFHILELCTEFDAKDLKDMTSSILRDFYGISGDGPHRTFADAGAAAAELREWATAHAARPQFGSSRSWPIMSHKPNGPYGAPVCDPV